MPTEEQQLHSNSRGRSSGGRLMSNLRSRSRSRAASKQRRSASAQPERRPSTTTNNVSSKLAEAKKRRSASRPAERSSSSSSKLLKKKTSSKSSSSKSRSKSRTATTSTTTRTRSKSAAPPRPQPQPRIINLVDVEQEEDDMLDALLNPAASPGGATAALAAQYDPTRDSPKSVGRFPDAATANNNKNKMAAYSSEEDEESSDDDSDDEEEEEEVDARDLLAQVNARMEQQRLMEDAKQLRATIEQKDTEIEQLTGQLRMAISTKCDLVIAHTELERLHESDMERRKHYADEVKRHNLYLQEVRAEVELEFMNELTQLATKVAETEERRQQEVTEKDLTIKLLEQKIYRMEKNALQGSSARPDNDKVKFYKKRLGVVADQ